MDGETIVNLTAEAPTVAKVAQMLTDALEEVVEIVRAEGFDYVKA